MAELDFIIVDDIDDPGPPVEEDQEAREKIDRWFLLSYTTSPVQKQGKIFITGSRDHG